MWHITKWKKFCILLKISKKDFQSAALDGSLAKSILNLAKNQNMCTENWAPQKTVSTIIKECNRIVNTEGPESCAYYIAWNWWRLYSLRKLTFLELLVMGFVVEIIYYFMVIKYFITIKVWRWLKMIYLN